MNSHPRSSRASVLLIGMGGTTLTALESLLDRFDVAGIVRPCADDGAPDPVNVLAQSHGIPIYADASMAAITALVTERQPDCVVVSSYNRILPARLLALSRFVNVHYALLPAYRGRANVNWALINGEDCTGITVHTVVPGLDAGAILFQQALPIGERDTIADLYDQLNAIQRDALGPTVERFLGGDPGTAQDETGATYGCARGPDDGEIDWSASTAQIDRLIRALVAPFPGAFTYFLGRRLIIHQAEPLADAPAYAGRIAGRVAALSKKHGYVDVLTGDGVLRLWQVETAESGPVAAARLITSTQDTLGLRTADLLSRIERLEQELARQRTQPALA